MPITLTTDFGITDPYVGVMKGVIFGIAPAANIIDITHAIEPQNIVQGAHILEAAHRYFAENTVHVAVVDPGVGTPRRAIAVEALEQRFVAPDNGILTPVLGPEAQVYELIEEKYFLSPRSSTFHGRDIFAPAAAWIASGVELSQMGPLIKDAKTLDLPEVSVKGQSLSGEIIHIDHFGNLVTNIPVHKIEEMFSGGKLFSIQLGEHKILGLVPSYAAGQPGKASGIINSWERLEIFIPNGNAQAQLCRHLGQPVTLTVQ